MNSSMARLCPVFLVVLACLGGKPASSSPEEEGSGSVTALRVRGILKSAEKADNNRLWKLSDELVRLGQRAANTILKETSRAPVRGQLCGYRALVALDRPSLAVDRLARMAKNDRVEVGNRVLALELLGVSEEPDGAEAILPLLKDLNPQLKLAAAKAIYNLRSIGRAQAKRTMQKMLTSSDAELRAQGAIALAEIGDAATPGVREILARLSDEPGIRGQLAKALLARMTLERTIDSLRRKNDRLRANPSGASKSWEHLDELRKKLGDLYGNDDAITEEKLRIKAARGMLEFENDPYTAFMSPEEHKQWNDSLDPSYGGIGALIDTNDTENFRIARPFFGGPAWEADIRTGDAIRKVNGKPTAGRETTDVIREIKGPPGTPVILTVERGGALLDIKVIRAKIVLPTVAHRVLPGRIGYIQIASFGEATGEEFSTQLQAMEKEGIDGLIIDLRWNPGGSLTTVKQSLTPFLHTNERICTVRGEKATGDRPMIHNAGANDRPRDYPIAVLINGRSASGAELMSGVLQYYSKRSKKAVAADGKRYLDVLVFGEPSFGKGTVQYKMNLDSWPGESFEDEPRKNGYYDQGEPLEDENKNRRWDPGEKWRDIAFKNRRWDDAEPWEDKNGNGTRDAGENYEDKNKDGRWNPAEKFDDANGNGEYDFGAALRMTVARYYLPGGRNFTRTLVKQKDGTSTYEGGVVPDVAVEGVVIPEGPVKELQELARADHFRNYVRDHWDKHKDAFQKLALGDGKDPSRYPEFEALYASLKTKATREHVREAVRIEVRRRVSNELGREIVGDVSADEQLQRALLSVLNRLERDPASVEAYRFLKTESK